MPIKGKTTATAAKPVAKPATAPKGAAPKAAATKAEGATITTTITILENGQIKGEPVETREIEVKKFLTDTAKASAGFSFSKNLGNYEAAKFNVMVTMPCYVEEIDSALDQVIDKAKTKLDEAIAQFDPSAYVSEAAGEDLAGGEGEAEAGDEGEAEGGEEITADWVREADRDALVELITSNQLDIDPNDYSDDDDGLNDLREMIIATAFAEDDGATEGEQGEEGADEPLTQEQLEAAETDELKSVYEQWEMGNFPKYTNAASEKVARKTAIKAILKRQDEAAAG